MSGWKEEKPINTCSVSGEAINGKQERTVRPKIRDLTPSKIQVSMLEASFVKFEAAEFATRGCGIDREALPEIKLSVSVVDCESTEEYLRSREI